MPDIPSRPSAALSGRYRLERELGEGEMATVDGGFEGSGWGVTPEGHRLPALLQDAGSAVTVPRVTAFIIYGELMERGKGGNR